MIQKITQNKAELIEMVKFYEPTYFIGYGSLMYPDGVNGRGMKHFYRWEDLIPVILHGFKRSFCATFKELAFYGIYRQENSKLNAVAFQIHNKHDYAMLLIDEGAHPVYKPVLYNVLNVRNSVEGFNFAEDARVMVLETCQVDEKTGMIPEYYVRHTWEGIQHWGEQFVQDFLNSGGRKYNYNDFSLAARNPWRDGHTLAAAERS